MPRRTDGEIMAGCVLAPPDRCRKRVSVIREYWNEAAASADFPFYEPVHPSIRGLSAGGFGYDGRTPQSLSIEAEIDGTSVSVDTQALGGRSSHSSQPARVADLIWHHLVSNPNDVELPLVLIVEPDVRLVRVDGSQKTFAGARVQGSSRWIGTADVGDVRVTITIDGDATLEAIVTSARDSLPGGGPNGC
jgi:hypothetical protein